MNILKPLNIGFLEIKNRFIMAPMMTNFAGVDGSVTKKYMNYVLERVKGGVGMVITEGAYIAESGKGFTRGLAIHKDELIQSHQKLTAEVHKTGGKIALQLHHSGRQTSSAVTGKTLISASPIPCPVMGETPKELNEMEIREIIDAYVSAAERAEKAGYDAIEIHGAHGYLINEFLSSYSNKRADSYGGSLENRARFMQDIIRSIKHSNCKLPIIFRTPGEEFVPDGIDKEEACKIANLAVESGADCLHVSGGVYESAHKIIQPAVVPQGIYLEHAKAIRDSIQGKVPVIVVGRIKKTEMAEKVVSEGGADAIVMGRSFLADPNYVKKFSEGKSDLIRPCIACNQGCLDNINKDNAITCVCNPQVGRENLVLEHINIDNSKYYIIAGAGPAGLETARNLAKFGNKVKIFDQRGYLGGQMAIAALPPGKTEINDFLKYLIEACTQSGVIFELNQPLTEEIIASENPNAVVVATGSTNFIPKLEGLVDYVIAEDVLLKNYEVEKSAAVIGGGLVGCETAEFLKYHNPDLKVTIVEMNNDIAIDMSPSAKALLEQTLLGNNIEVQVNTMSTGWKDGILSVRSNEEESTIEADSVIFATGYRPNKNLMEICKAMGITAACIGDSVRPRNILSAVHEGYDTAKLLLEG